MGVIAVHFVDRGQRFLSTAESKQAGAGREKSAEAGFLGDHRPPGGKITDAPIAEPAATGGHVPTLGNSKLGFRFLNELPIRCGSAGHAGRIEKLPAVLGQGRQVCALARMNRQGRQKSFGGQSRERDVLAGSSAGILTAWRPSTPIGKPPKASRTPYAWLAKRFTSRQNRECCYEESSFRGAGFILQTRP